MVPLDLNDPDDLTIDTSYEFTFEPGILKINKLPITITPRYDPDVRR